MAVGAPAAIACNDIACTYEVEGQIDEALAWWQRSAQADAGYVYPVPSKYSAEIQVFPSR